VLKDYAKAAAALDESGRFSAAEALVNAADAISPRFDDGGEELQAAMPRLWRPGDA
jgi:hypothetical protein